MPNSNATYVGYEHQANWQHEICVISLKINNNLSALVCLISFTSNSVKNIYEPIAMLIRCMRQYIMNMEELSAVMSAVCNKAHRRQQPEKRSKYRSLGSPVYNSCSWMIQTEFVCPEEYLHFQISHSRMRHCQRRSSRFDSWMADYFVPIPMH